MKYLVIAFLALVSSSVWASGSPQAKFYQTIGANALICKTQSATFHLEDQLGNGASAYPKLFACISQAESEGKKAYKALLARPSKLKSSATSLLSSYLTYLRFMEDATSQGELEASSQKAEFDKASNTFEVEAGL